MELSAVFQIGVQGMSTKQDTKVVYRISYTDYRDDYLSGMKRDNQRGSSRYFTVHSVALSFRLSARV